MSLNELLRYWTAINQPIDPVERIAVETDESGGETSSSYRAVKLRFTDATMRWGTIDENEILLRHCYYQAIQFFDGLAAGRVGFGLVEGSSGIGKTVWIYFLIYRKTRGSLHLPANGRPTFCVQNANGSIVHLHYDVNGTPVVTKGLPVGMDPDYFISDTIPLCEPSAKILHLHVASVGNSDTNFQKFLEDQKNTRYYMFPPFSREEHLACKGVRNPVTRLWANKEELQLRYDVFGGCLRLLHCEEPKSPFPENLSVLALEELRSFFKDVYSESNNLITNQFQVQLVQFAKAIASELSKAESKAAPSIPSPTGTARLRTLFQHQIPQPSGGYLSVASSKFMDFFGATLLENEQTNIWQLIKSFFGNSGAGLYFEKCAHEEVINRLKSPLGLTVQKMHPTQTRTADPVKCPVSRKVFIRKWEDITNLQPNEYGFPINSNLPLIDSVVKMATGRHLVFQMTIQKITHSSGAINDEQALYEHFVHHNHAHLMLINVLHVDNYDTFRYDERLPAARWDQYKAYGESVVGVKRKASKK
jgi:hypothetical protein